MYKLIALRHKGAGIYTPYTRSEYVMYCNCYSDQCDFFFSSDLSQSIQLNNIQSLHRAAVVAVGLFTMSYVYRIGEE